MGGADGGAVDGRTDGLMLPLLAEPFPAPPRPSVRPSVRLLGVKEMLQPPPPLHARDSATATLSALETRRSWPPSLGAALPLHSALLCVHHRATVSLSAPPALGASIHLSTRLTDL